MMCKLALALALSAALPLAAQTEQQSLKEAVSVGYVMIPFTVLGVEGNPITNLAERDIELDVDGVTVRRDLFEKSENAPVSFTILVDGSGSMALAGKMDAARAALDALIAHRREGDDFALYLFDDRQVHELVPFTTDPSAVTRALATIKPHGKTAFFDAVSTMPERSRLGRNATRAIILLSDGIDNASTLTRADLAAKLQGLGIPIYPLGLREPAEQLAARSDERSDLDILEDVASLTGGHLFVGNRPEQLASAIASMEKDLRAQYLIGFTPTGRGAVKYRHISLRLAGRGRSVRVRAGYLGTEPPAVPAATQTNAKSKRNERKRS